jgi:nitrite reductase/ring-hydroxylating ferredoxin subunit
MILAIDGYCDRQGCLAEGAEYRADKSGVIRLVCKAHGWVFGTEAASCYPSFVYRERKGEVIPS